MFILSSFSVFALWEYWSRTSFPIIATHLWFKIFFRWNKVWFLIVEKEIIWSHELSLKEIFIFIKNFIEQHVHCFVPLPSPIFRQLHDSIFPKLLIFLSKQLFHVPFTVFQRIEIFFIKIICKDRNKWKSKMWCLVNMVGESELPSQAVTVVVRSAEKHAVLRYSYERLCLLLTNSGRFSSSAARVGLIGCSTCWNEPFDFPEGAHNRGLSSSLTVFLLWMTTGLGCSWW